MLSSCRASFWLAVPAFAVLAFLMPTGAVVAQKKGKAPQTLSNAQLVESIQTLRVARVSLEMANHDYGGHRVAAVREINGAIKHLRLALDHAHKGRTIPKGGKGGVTGGGEPQAISDTQLAAAVPALVQTATLLKMANHDYGGHRAVAVAKLEAAVGQINTALKYSQVRNQNK